MFQLEQVFRWLETEISSKEEETLYTPLKPSSEDARNLLPSLSEEPWVKGLIVDYNPSSNTISLFDDFMRETQPSLQRNIPLRYRGIPIIVHDYACDPNRIPVAHQLSQSVDTLKDGLTGSQLRELQDFIPDHIHSIEFYLDRQVIVTLSSETICNTVSKLGFGAFRAWDCVFILTIPRIYETWHQHPSFLGIPKLGASGLLPGLKINNDLGVVSRAGIFLRSRLPKACTISHFLISAHSFVKKKRLKLGLNLSSSLVLLSIVLFFVVSSKIDQSCCKFPTNITVLLVITRIGLLILCLFNGFGTLLVPQFLRASLQSAIQLTILYCDTVLLVPQFLVACIRWTAKVHMEKYPIPPKWVGCLMETISLDCGFALLLLSIPRDHEPLISRLLFSIISSQRWRTTLSHVPPLLIALSFCYCLYNPVALTLTYDLPFRFLAGFTACIELIHIVWDLDFVFLFNLLEQPVLRGHEKIGKIVHGGGFFGWRLFCPENYADCNRNVALAELSSPRSSEGYTLLPWSELEPNRDSRLFAIIAEEPLDEGNNRVHAKEGLLGGFRYVFPSVGESCYGFYSTMLWRSESSSMTEDPGTMLLSLETNGGISALHVVAFQAFALSEDYSLHPPGSRKPVTWKLASKPPRELIEMFDCMVPRGSLQNVLRS